MITQALIQVGTAFGRRVEPAALGDHYLFIDEIHFYRTGDSTVPTGKWVLNDRFRSGRILPEKIGKQEFSPGA